jgi:hypothetical protein
VFPQASRTLTSAGPVLDRQHVSCHAIVYTQRGASVLNRRSSVCRGIGPVGQESSKRSSCRPKSPGREHRADCRASPVTGSRGARAESPMGAAHDLEGHAGTAAGDVLSFSSTGGLCGWRRWRAFRSGVREEGVCWIAGRSRGQKEGYARSKAAARIARFDGRRPWAIQDNFT